MSSQFAPSARTENAITMVHLRHATSLLNLAGIRILLDPMLGEKGAIPASKLMRNPLPNPVVELPARKARLVDTTRIADVDLVLLTHTHFDHFDDTAAAVLPRDIPVICQPADESRLAELGFTQILAVQESLCWNGLDFIRTQGHHGTGAVRKLMGASSGWGVKHAGGTLFIGGDAIFDELFEQHLNRLSPDTVVLFGGEARLKLGGPITMGSRDILQTAATLPKAKIVVTHMEALSHCGLTRSQLKADLAQAGVDGRVSVPEDGQTLSL